ncbi:class I adenylate-forming enzyme family protein [Pararobbsia silviterrae]|uniref:class I adenylate-forming enzyme family protein n=1 Tax=Pararobbsia silviterrae TaxID=1792498 RepID=UPI001314F857|nr:class I adenylate-forming enzyme family protein [Pararobbsia silviterrae]
MNIAEQVERQAKRRPAAIALITLERVWTYRELIVASHALARKLLESGVQPGHRIGVSMLQTPLHLMTVLALARIGAVSVPVHVAQPVAQRLAVVHRFGIAAIVSGRRDFALEVVPFIDLSGIDLTAPTDLPACTTGPDDPFRIVLSSGTTGEPKGVLYGHRYMLDRTRHSMQSFHVDARSRLLPMDLNFTIGFVYAIGTLLEGGSVVLGPVTTPPDMVQQVRLLGVTHWLLSPIMAEQIGALMTDDDIHFPSVEHLRMTGAKPGQKLLDMLFRRFTPNVFEHYGLTEIGALSIATPELLRRAPDSAGRIDASMTVEVVGADDQPLPAGSVGSLRVKAPFMIDGYLGELDKATSRFRNGWYYTGDFAHIDAEGLLFVAGREDNVINIGGSKFAPWDIEHVLQSHPLVREAIVFALPQSDGLPVLAAALAVSNDVSIDELHVWARSRLGPRTPARLFVVDALPRTITGKVQRERIGALLGNEQR